MANSNRRKYTDEFKKETVSLVRQSGKSLAQIGRELGISDANISRWCQEYGMGNEELEKTSVNMVEYRALKAELRRVTEERDILKKVLNIFSRSG